MAKPNDRELVATGAAETPAGPTRRDFLQASAAMASATLLTSCLSGNNETSPSLPGIEEPLFLANINHLVVVMFENRSFDNLLGYLYAQGPTPRNWPAGWPLPPSVPASRSQAQQFEGLWQFPGVAPAESKSCTGILGCNSSATKYEPVLAHPHDWPTYCTPAGPMPPGLPWNYPDPNPDEGLHSYYGVRFPDPATIGKVENGQIGKLVSKAGDPRQWDMSGFVEGYKKKADDANPKLDYKPIMGSYTSDQLPVISTLARNFAVFDHWFCAVPAETYCNRALFHASTSWGYTENAQTGETTLDRWKTPPTFVSGDSIFDALEQAGITWGVYFSGAKQCPASSASSVEGNVGLTGLIHYEVGKTYGPACYQDPKTADASKQRFWPVEDLLEDLRSKDGKLNQYTFIEPLGGKWPFPDPQPPFPPDTAYFGNSYHPNQDVRYGEEVLREIYEAIRTNPERSKDTMLLVVFDEHGGTYDHVSPPDQIPAPWTTNPPPLEYGFPFTTLGLRVPAIAISQYTLPGTIVNTPMHHAAVINTLFRKFISPKLKSGEKNYLTERDKGGNGGDLGKAYNGIRATAWPPLLDRVDPPNVPLLPPCKAT